MLHAVTPTKVGVHGNVRSPAWSLRIMDPAFTGMTERWRRTNIKGTTDHPPRRSFSVGTPSLLRSAAPRPDSEGLVMK